MWPSTCARVSRQRNAPRWPTSTGPGPSRSLASFRRSLFSSSATQHSPVRPKCSPTHWSSPRAQSERATSEWRSARQDRREGEALPQAAEPQGDARGAEADQGAGGEAEHQAPPAFRGAGRRRSQARRADRRDRAPAPDQDQHRAGLHAALDVGRRRRDERMTMPGKKQ